MLSESELERLREVCKRRGAAEHVEAIAALARPAVRVRLTRAEGEVPVGVTRFGGDPDVASGFAWPWREGRPLAFIAQVECAAVHGLIGECGLPREGLLSFFYDAVEQPWGCDVGDRGSSVILHFAPGQALERVGAPDFEVARDWGRHARQRFEPAVARLEVETTWPGFETRAVERLGLDPFIYAGIVHEMMPDEGPFHVPCNQVMGWARQVQGPMATECAARWAGLGPAPIGNPFTGQPGEVETSEVVAKRDAARADADRWRMVLQVDSDDALDTEWGDTGMVYFWVREDSLEDGSFEVRWAELQCS